MTGEDSTGSGCRAARGGLFTRGRSGTEGRRPAAAETTADDAGLSPGTAYCYAVSAVDGAGNESPRTAEVCVQTPWGNAVIVSASTGFTLGRYNDLALGVDDHLHASFQSVNSRLGYARFSGGSWASDTVSPSDAVHLSYPAPELTYATNGSGAWQSSVVDDSGAGGGSSALVVDSAGQVHVIYNGCDGGCLRHATK